MSISGYFLSPTSTATHFAPTRRPHQQYFNKQHKKRSASLVEMYSAIAKQNDFRGQQIFTLRIPKEKMLPARQGKRNDVFESSISHRIEKTIDSVKEYSQQIKSALVKQYKSQRMQVFQARKTQRQNDLSSFTSPTQIQALNSVIQSEKTKNQTERILKIVSPKAAFKTLQLLYQTIIDQTIAKRKKEEWEVQAVRLPMVDRLRDRSQLIKFQRHLRARSKIDRAENYLNSLPTTKDERVRHSEPSVIHIESRPARKQVNLKKKKSIKGSMKDSVEINPWLTSQDIQYD